MRFDDGSTMRLYRQTVEDFGLYPGKELSEQEMKDLKVAAGAMSAKMRAVRIVAASSVSKKDLQRRLVAKREDPKIIGTRFLLTIQIKWMRSCSICVII